MNNNGNNKFNNAVQCTVSLQNLKAEG